MHLIYPAFSSFIMFSNYLILLFPRSCVFAFCGEKTNNDIVKISLVFPTILKNSHLVAHIVIFLCNNCLVLLPHNYVIDRNTLLSVTPLIFHITLTKLTVSYSYIYKCRAGLFYDLIFFAELYIWHFVSHV
jgi:hypothetical protein